MNDEQGPAPGPEPLPEPGPVSVPAAAQALGISERAVRKRINAGTLRAQPFGRSFMVWLPDDAPAVGPEPGPAPGPEPGPEPIEAIYRVTPVEIEQAVSRTGAQYMGDLRAMLAEVGNIYEGQLTAKDEALAAKDETIATKEQVIATQREALATKDQALAADALAIDELRRRAEVAEAEVARQQKTRAERRKKVVAHILARNQALGVHGTILLSDDEVDRIFVNLGQPEEHPAPASSPTRWERLLARFRST